MTEIATPSRYMPPVPLKLTRTIKEPAKRWRNKWRVPPFCYAIAVDTGERIPAGPDGVIWSPPPPKFYPSKDVAEQKAADDIAHIIARGISPAEYLGAFPAE